MVVKDMFLKWREKTQIALDIRLCCPVRIRLNRTPSLSFQWWSIKPYRDTENTHKHTHTHTHTHTYKHTHRDTLK
jgi:hypothetical protein